MTQEEIRDAREQHSAIMTVVLCLTILVIGIIVVSAYNIFSIDPPPEQIKTAKHDPVVNAAEKAQLEGSTEVIDPLLQKTNYLGSSIYGEDGHYIGKLYDAYFDPDGGKIEYLSVNVFGVEDGYFILLTADQAEDITLMSDTMVVNEELADFIKKPLQMENDKTVEGLISLRNVVENKVKSEPGEDIAEVTYVTFDRNRVLEQIYFKTEADPLRGVKEEYYNLPFTSVDFNDPEITDELAQNIVLTPIQASAVKAHSRSRVVE